MKKTVILFWLLLITPALFAASSDKPQRGVFAGIARLHGRGLANAALFPVEWPRIAVQEARAHKAGVIVTFIPQVMTHFAGRFFSGVSDAVFLPLYYPFSHYDDSLPVGMGWPEFPWQKS